MPCPHPAALVRCRFYVKTPAGNAGWNYDLITLESPDGSGTLATPHPPADGDLISLYDTTTKRAVNGRVVQRAWHHASWGSSAWPLLEPLTTAGPSLDIIVVPDVGPFCDQAPGDDK